LKAPALLLIVLGLLLGPGYYLFCERLSGRDSASFELGARAERWTLDDGSILHFRSGLAYRPVPLDLHPEHNHVRLSLTFVMPSEGASTGINEYQATLFDGDHPLLQRTLRVGARPGESTSVTAGTVAIHTPAEHLFVLEELGSPRLTPSRVTLTVRETVEQPVRMLVWSGIALLLAGIGIGAYALIAPRL
jgi:hypothetical protein